MEGTVAYPTSGLDPRVNQILPRGKRTSLIVDDAFITKVQNRQHNGKVHLYFGTKEHMFNCVVFSKVNVDVTSIIVFARTVIIDDATFDCEGICFYLQNELEIRSGKLQFSAMNVDAKWVNVEKDVEFEGNELVIRGSKTASLSGLYKLDKQLSCQAQELCIDEGSQISTKDLLLFPTKKLQIKSGELCCEQVFLGGYNEVKNEVMKGTAMMDVLCEVKADKMNVCTDNDVVLSGSISLNKSFDCSSSRQVKLDGCTLKGKSIRVEANSVHVDKMSLLDGSEIVIMTKDKVVLDDLSSFQFDKFLVIDSCRIVSSENNNEKLNEVVLPKFRSGDFFINTEESIELQGTMKCKNIFIRQKSSDLTIGQNVKINVDSFVVEESQEREENSGKIVFRKGSSVVFSKCVSIKTYRDIIMKGSLKKELYYSPKLIINTSKSIKLYCCTIHVAETQLWFGEMLLLSDNSSVYISGQLFMLHFLKQNDSGTLQLSKDSSLVARADIICQFGECYVEGVFTSENGSILLGQNNNQDCNLKKEPIEKKGRIKYVLQDFVKNLKPSAKPLQCLLRKIQQKRMELISIVQKIVQLKDNPVTKSFVMEYIFISGRVKAKKTVMLVSKDISIQNQSSIECTSDILMYSNRSIFQCSSELGASSVIIVSPIVFQLASLIKAHNFSVSAVMFLRLACLCVVTKSMIKVPLILSGLNIVAPNINKTLQRIEKDLIENCSDVWMCIEKLAKARMENREFETFLAESIRLFKKHFPKILLHSLELAHFVLNVVNLLVPSAAILITVSFISIVRATVFLLFSVKSIHKSIKRYLTCERHNFIVVEIVGESMFSIFQAVNLSNSVVSLFDQIKNLRSGISSNIVDTPTLRDRTRIFLSGGPLLALSNLLQVFDTFVLNDYTKYAVGMFSYIPSSMSFGLINLCGDLKMGMYVVNNSSACSVSGSLIILSYNCSSTDLLSFSPDSNVVICSNISESSTIGKVDRGVKISSRLNLTGKNRAHEGGYHFGESIVLKIANFDQQNNKLIYNRIGGVSVKGEWNVKNSTFSPLLHKDYEAIKATQKNASPYDGFDGEALADNAEKNVQRSRNLIECLSVGNESLFFLKETALRINKVKGGITVKNVQVKISSDQELSSLKIAGGMNTFVSECNLDISFPIHLANEGIVNIFSPSSTIVNVQTRGNGNVAFFNAEIGQNADIQHAGSVLFELKNENDLSAAIKGEENFSKIANDGRVNFKILGDFNYSNKFFESPVREKQDIGVIANSIDIGEMIERERGVHLFSTQGDVVIRRSIISDEGSVIIQSKNGNVFIEDNVEKGSIITECLLDWDGRSSFSEKNLVIIEKEEILTNVEKVELNSIKDSVVITSERGNVRLDPCNIYGEKGVYLEGETGVEFGSYCVTTVTTEKSPNPIYSNRKKIIKGIAETSSISSNGDIIINSSKGEIVTKGINVISHEGIIQQNGRDGVFNESIVTETSISAKRTIIGGLVAKEKRNEDHEEETPCCFSSTKGIHTESEKGTIKNIGTIITGNEVASFKAKNVVFERRILNHEICVKKRGFGLSLSLLGCNVFKSTSNFFENLKTEILEYHLPPIGVNPIDVARSLKEGNVPETAANIMNALLPGNLLFQMNIPKPVEFGVDFNDYELKKHTYDSLGEGVIEMDYLSIKSENSVEFNSSFGFNVGGVEIEAKRFIENGAFLNFQIEIFSSGIAFNLDPLRTTVFLGVPSLTADLLDTKEISSIGVCQIGNAAYMKVTADEWAKKNSQTFVETIEGRIENVHFDSSSSTSESKRHSISVGTSSFGLGDNHSKASLVTDQTGLFVVNAQNFRVENVFLRSSRCPVFGTESNSTEDVTEFEKANGASFGVDFGNIVGGKSDLTKVKRLGIERKNYEAKVISSFEMVDENEFFYRVINSEQEKAENLERLKELEGGLGLLLGHENKFQKAQASDRIRTDDDSSIDEFNCGYLPYERRESSKNTTGFNSASFLKPLKEVVRDAKFHLRFHYDHEYYLQSQREKLKKELINEGVLPGLGDLNFDGNPQLLEDVVNIFYDSSICELDKYTQLLFCGDFERKDFDQLTPDDQQNVLLYKWFLEEGGNFWDIESYSLFREERLKDLNEYDSKIVMKDYVNENYPELFLSSELYKKHEIDDIFNVYVSCASLESDNPLVEQMNAFFTKQLYPDAGWEELTSSQKSYVDKIREYALMYQQTNQDVDFAEFCNTRETLLNEYLQKNAVDKSSLLTVYGILPEENQNTLLENDYYKLPQIDKKKYPSPGSGLFFLLPVEKGGWEGMKEFFALAKNCFSDYYSFGPFGKSKTNYEPSKNEIYVDKSLRSFFSGLTDFTPFVNMVKWGFQGIAGYDPITKNSLPWDERIFDFTFSLFLFPHTASVIVGYGKAGWETVKGVGKIGKVFVMDRNLKGVFDTIKMTGKAAVENVAVPMEHLGRAVFWNVNKSASSFKFAGEWFKNTAEWFTNKTAGFHGSWKQYTRNYDVSKIYAMNGRQFAYEGGVATTGGIATAGGVTTGEHFMEMGSGFKDGNGKSFFSRIKNRENVKRTKDPAIEEVPSNKKKEIVSQESTADTPYKEIVYLRKNADMTHVLDNFDAFILNSNVLWNSNECITPSQVNTHVKAMKETLQTLEKQGKRIFIQTNDDHLTTEGYSIKLLRRMDFLIPPERIVTSGTLVGQHLLKSGYDLKKKVYIVYGDRGLDLELAKFGISTCGSGVHSKRVYDDVTFMGDFKKVMNEYFDSNMSIGAVVVSGSNFGSYNFYPLAFGGSCVRFIPKCNFISTNPYMVTGVHVEKGTELEKDRVRSINFLGEIVELVERQPFVCGIPNSMGVEHIIKQHQLDRSRVLFVGDRLNTDIRMANKANLKSLCVSKKDLSGLSQKAKPTYVIGKLHDLVKKNIVPQPSPSKQHQKSYGGIKYLKNDPEKISQFIADHDAFILNSNVLWNVVWKLTKNPEFANPLPFEENVRGTLKMLAEKRKKLFVQTNDEWTREEYSKLFYHTFGLSIPPTRIVTSASLTALHLKKAGLGKDTSSRVFVVMGSSQLEAELMECGVEYLGYDVLENYETDGKMMKRVLSDESVSAVVVSGANNEVTNSEFDRLFFQQWQFACNCVASIPNCKIYITNPDRELNVMKNMPSGIMPMENPPHGTVPMSIVEKLKGDYRSLSHRGMPSWGPTIIGTPNSFGIETICKDFRLRKSNVCFIGGRPDIDCKMANKAKVESLLVTHGQYSNDMLEKLKKKRKPSYVIENLTDLNH